MLDVVTAQHTVQKSFCDILQKYQESRVLVLWILISFSETSLFHMLKQYLKKNSYKYKVIVPSDV